MTELRLDLKVCEACGALWLRANRSRVYCRRCALLLAEFPAPRGLRRKPVAGARRLAVVKATPKAATASVGGGR
jgi:predicted amidophosphoribosyltransferase